MPPASATAQLADHLLKGQLKERIAAWRAEHRSWDWIAKTIWADTDKRVSVTGPTVQAWAERLGIEAAA